MLATDVAALQKHGVSPLAHHKMTNWHNLPQSQLHACSTVLDTELNKHIAVCPKGLQQKQRQVSAICSRILCSCSAATSAIRQSSAIPAALSQSCGQDLQTLRVAQAIQDYMRILGHVMSRLGLISGGTATLEVA